MSVFVLKLLSFGVMFLCSNREMEEGDRSKQTNK